MKELTGEMVEIVIVVLMCMKINPYISSIDL